MAFNPFHTFRKHQKVIFAVLTIICMFVFILQFGNGDILSRFGLGRGGQGKGDKVVTLYGRDLTGGDLERLRQSRQLANEFVVQALAAAQKAVSAEVQEYRPEKIDQADMNLLDVRQAWTQRSSMLDSLEEDVREGRKNRQQASQEFQFQMAVAPAEIRQDFTKLSNVERTLAAGENADKAKADDQARMLADLRCLLRKEYYDYTSPQTPLYFGGAAKRDEDLLDFEIWKHQADQLGVVLTKADARRATAHEAADRDLPADPGGSWRADPVFKDFFAAHQQQVQQLKEDDLATAVADEFRVLIAKGLMGGPIAGVPGADAAGRLIPDPATPYGFWKFYRDNRTTLKVAFLPISVDAFLDKVQEQPATPELMDLFNDYKSQVPEPDKPTPAFKEPRRMKVEYITADAESPYYKAWAETAKGNLEKFYVAAPTAGNLVGGGVAPLAAFAGILSNDQLQADYDAEVADKYKTSLAAAKHLFVSGFGPYAALSAPAVAFQAGELQDAPTRERLAAAALLAGNGAAAGSPFANLGLPIAALPAPFPRDETLRQLVEKRQKDLTNGAVMDDVEAFRTELTKIKNDPEKVKDYIQKTVKAHGWDYEDKAGLDDQYALNDDPALKPLKTVVDQRLGSMSSLLFDQLPAGAYQFVWPLSDGPGKMLAFWRSEDKRSQELGFDEAEPRVREAWKLQRARVLALREANRIDTEAAAQANPDEARRKLMDQKLGEVFELSNIARLVPDVVPDQGHSATYHAYTIPAANISSAPDDLLDRLLTLDRPGKTLLFKDKPGKRFYVAVLEERPPLDMKDSTGFKAAFDEATQDQKDQFWRRYFLPDRRKDYHDRLMRQLREEAGAVNDKGELVLSNRQQQQQQQQQQPNPLEGEGLDFGD